MSVDVPLALGLAVVVVTVAALVDLRRRRIPNWLTAGAFGGGLVLNVVEAGASGGLTAVAGGALGLAILLPFFLAGGIGAGDVKLLAGLGALVGPQMLVSVAIYGALAGGAMSVILLNQVFVRGPRLPRRGVTSPYGVAIALGVYLTFLLPAVIR
jgi:prepilin peptidase CpaA